jgi:signal transduction histidine kinase
LELADVLARVSRLVIPQMADWYVLAVRQPSGEIRLAAHAHADAALRAHLAAYVRSESRVTLGPSLLATVIESGKAGWIPNVDTNPSGASDVCDWNAVQLAGLGTGSIICTPLVLGLECLGAMLLVRSAPGAYSRYDRDLAAELARRVAVIVSNARDYETVRVAAREQAELLAVAAHELRTPVTALSGYAQLLVRRLACGEELPPAEMQRVLTNIDAQARRVSALISRLFDTARADSGKLTLQRERADLRALLDKVVDLLRAAKPGRQVIVEAPSAIVARVDALRIEQVLLNLLDNAIKFSPANSPVEVHLEVVHGNQARLSVRDYGLGVPAHLRDRIFDRFVQGTLTDHSGGLGLGLYLGRHIVEEHGGHIYAEFPSDGGARFVIELDALSAGPPSRPLVTQTPRLAEVLEVAADHA